MTQLPQWDRALWALLLGAMMVTGLSSDPAQAGHDAAQRDPVEMVVIPAGPFIFGSTKETGREDEWPRRKIALHSFAIDKFEVTNARFLAFVKQTGHRYPPNPYGEGLLKSVRGIENLPVVPVNWYDASEYCQWAGKRLPTEAEWEKAARGSDGRMYPWGNEPPTKNHANFERDWDGTHTLHQVGALPAGNSTYGVADMAGNAREWVQDWYHPEYYGKAPNRNPQGPENGVLRVIRGGSWHSPVQDIRAAARGKGGFALKTHGVGFRCAKDVKAER